MYKLSLFPNGRYFGVATIFLFVVLAPFSNSASALLISEGSSFGADTVTLDTDTRLEWLDPLIAGSWGEICCRSYSEVTAELAGGGLFEGFRWATAEELKSLFFVSAGIQPGSEDASDSIAGLIELVGSTFDREFSPGYSFSATTAYYDSGDPLVPGLASLEVKNFMSAWEGGKAYIAYSSDSPGMNGGSFGSWLVRDTEVVKMPIGGGISYIFVGILAATQVYRKRI